MDLDDLQMLLKDLTRFAKDLQNQLKWHQIHGLTEAKSVLNNKIETVHLELTKYSPGKEEKAKLSKLRKDFITVERECRVLMVSLETYKESQPLKIDLDPLPGNDQTQVFSLIPVEKYEPGLKKSEEIQKLAQDITTLNSMMTDTMNMVNVQGENVASVEKLSETAVSETAKAGTELQKAAILQNKQWKWYFGGGLGTVGGILGLLGGPIGVPIGAAVGGVLGTAFGKAIETHQNEDLNSIRFDDT